METDNARAWVLDFESEEDGGKKPVAAELQRFLSVAQKHESELEVLKSEVVEDKVVLWPLERRASVVRLEVRPPERAPAIELAQTGERSLRKVIGVFAFVGDEVRELADLADAHFVPGLSCFGDGRACDEVAPGPGQREVEFGRALPFLQELSNFVDRCHACALNLVQQLAALYSPVEESYAVTFRDVRLEAAFQSLADLLALLVTVDLAVDQNEALAAAWADYKRLLQRVRSDPDAWAPALGGSDAARRLAKFERLLADLDRCALRANCFRVCAEQDFEELEDDDDDEEDDRRRARRTISVRSNHVLLKEFERAVKSQLERCSGVVGTPSETQERQQLVGTVALYAFSRRLAPASAEPDAKLYRTIWSLEKKVPVITLAAGRALPFFVADFLQDHAPPPPATIRKLDPSPDSLASARRDACRALDADFEARAKTLQARCRGFLAKAKARFARCPAAAAADSGGASRGQAAEALLEQRAALLLRGLALARAHATLLRSCVAFHVSLATPFAKRALAPLCSIVEGLKAIEHAVCREHAASIAESASGASRALARAMLAQFGPLRVKLERKRFASTAGRLDALAAVDAATALLSSSDVFSPSRVGVLGLALSIAFNDKTAPESATTERRCKDRAVALLRRLELLSTLDHRFARACDCSTLYWSRELFDPMLETVGANAPSSLPRVVAAAADVAPTLRAAQHAEDPAALVDGWATFVVDALEARVVLPLCHQIENDLRVRAHSLGAARHRKSHEATTTTTMSSSSSAAAPSSSSHSPAAVVGSGGGGGGGNNGAAAPAARKRFANNNNNHHHHHREATDQQQQEWRTLTLLNLPPVRVLDRKVDLKRRVGAYLEKTFYDLTVVALHDWATYAEMRALALQSYDLELRDNHLPMGSLDVGLDVLRIMQNIDVFVSKFSYNLNQQNFVERKPDRGSKNVRAISIRSIASSLRQHGLGVLNTTVNYTYQFLAQKFHVFSQFLYDDYIRSHLGKERRWFRKHRDQCASMYPYDRAADFQRDIRKLGVGDDGHSFLDHFRVLITEIGNALGYVRMVRSAGAAFCADAASFVPDFDEVPTDDVDSTRFSETTRRALANLRSVVDTLSRNFAEGRDYFKVLVNVFKKVLLSGDHAHLDNFYTIVPALCLSWVDASLLAKDRMFKQNRTREAYYADDGFAVGIAYVLAILEQGSRFDSLHWFDRVKSKLLADEAQLEKRLVAREEKKARDKKRSWFLSSGKHKQPNRQRDEQQEGGNEEEEDGDDDSNARALQLTGRRIKATKRENELLYFSISGARVFFRRNE
ncbi:hypothetical protein CTAYLR_005928 [Chrysophaeum taylorii]|uniref:WASH complex subunit 7 n=1 Tax=Chrysophaeum taylorii TaxID=2483200 RepID=A0AAD7UAP8_9STRA|nr:hypothetical protein CTAYLR_005928 [Chrysophaeum taylorii]